MKKNNPFTLTFGKQPGEYIYRYENTDTIVSTFEADNPISQAYLIEGVRGSGKTVLMTAIANIFSERDEWVVVDLNSTQDLITDFAQRLCAECNKIPNLLKSGFSVSVAGFGVGVNGIGQTQDNVGIIDSILSSLKKKNKKVLITIDEAMPSENMRFFASQFQIFIRKDYPIYLLMTGLYENIYAIQNDPALTFLLRTPKINMEPLSIPQITKQYKAIFKLETEDAHKMALITKGYAFAFQALGMLYYEYNDTLQWDELLSKFDDLLDDFVYKKIWEGLSEKDRELVRVIGTGVTSVSDICEKLQISNTSFPRYKERLLKKGVLSIAGRGLVELSLPRFAEVVELYP
ncbi:ATP-binding protein [Butyrivibrio fibrisolvens]|uniref:ATP-binding protein n=1 Tax=Pseudobutyrivibrio ruminis TaxID=46206 RepID=UPI000415D771|nr:ATP-binding protein [Pseudobutyrivibrio ruminis]MDC7278416.1 ATP-binding protein [Butyrivibrio fibrisolvens]